MLLIIGGVIMYVGITLILCSLVYSLLIIIAYCVKKRINTQETKIYNYMMVVNFFNLILELLCCYTVFNIDKMPFFAEIINRLFLITIFYWQTLFTLYNYTISFKSWKNDKLNFNTRIGKIFLIIVFMMLVGILFLPLKYYNHNNIVYSYGPSADFLYLIVTVYFISWLVMYIKKYNNDSRKKYLPVLFFIIIMGIALVIRALSPGILIISSSFAFVTNLMFFTIENPDVKLLDEVHKSKEISDAANEEKTLFLYNMTQEIRNTMNDINDNVDMILESVSLDENKECAREIKGIVTKFNSMANEMFDVSKMDASNIKVYNNKYNIKNILKEIVTIYSNKCKDKDVNFRVSIDHDVPEVLYGDSIGLKEVLGIVMDNSVKYTANGFIEFDVNTIIKNNVCRLIITIEDSGMGIKSDDINKMKIDDKSLAKANKLITLMNGTMMISSNYGFGTKVKIILDQKIEVEVNETVAKYEGIYEDIKILMVDDSDSGIKIIDKLIKGSNINMDFATNGKDCINKIKINDKYDVILLDEQLSQISAMELIEKIKNIRNFDIPIILLTKDNSYEYSDEFKKIGFSDYILKPVKKDDLLSKINKCVKKD